MIPAKPNVTCYLLQLSFHIKSTLFEQGLCSFATNMHIGRVQTKHICDEVFDKYLSKYQPSGTGGTRSPPTMPHLLQNPKWPLGGPKRANGVWKGAYS